MIVADVDPRLRRLVRVLELASLWFVVVGLSVAAFGTSRAFAPYDAQVARTFFGAEAVPAHARAVQGFLYGVLGASIAGKWAAMALLARHALARRARWAWVASVQALLAWFVIDGAASIARGALFNVLMINLAPLVMVGAPLWLARASFAADEPPPPPAPGASAVRAFVVAAALLGVVGLALSAFGTTAAFGFYEVRLARVFYGADATPPDTTRLIAFLYGPIGGTIVGHMILLAAIARRALAAGERWALVACAGSIGVWLVVNLTASIAFGAWFDVAWVELPTVALLGGPLVAMTLARARA